LHHLAVAQRVHCPPVSASITYYLVPVSRKSTETLVLFCLGLRTGTEETGLDRPVHPSVRSDPSWTEDRIYVSFIFYKTPQSATCRNPAPPPLVYYYFFCIFQQGVSSSPAACVLYCYFPSLITSISLHLCLVLFFFNQQCGKVQCTMRNAGDW